MTRTLVARALDGETAGFPLVAQAAASLEYAARQVDHAVLSLAR